MRAVDGISFSVEQGKTLGIVGESGCGKSVTALSIMGLIPKPPAKIVGGAVAFDGRDLTTLGERQLEEIRGREIAMIFQDPMTSLNPSLRSARRSPRRSAGTATAAEARAQEGDRAAGGGADPQRRRAARATTRTASRAGCASA